MERRLADPAPAADRPGKRLTDDDRLRAELELCDRWGIPHSQFRGHGDGTWSDLDRRKALAYRDYTRTVCPQCGTRPTEWDEAAGGDENAYVAVDHRCVGCQLIADKQDDVPTGAEGHGIKVFLLPAQLHAAQQLLKQLQQHTDDGGE